MEECGFKANASTDTFGHWNINPKKYAESGFSYPAYPHHPLSHHLPWNFG